MLVCDNVSKKYKKNVLNHFSYTFEKGKIYSIIGPSGCGKSTLLSIISSSSKKYEGKVMYDGCDIKKQINYAFLKVGYVYQNYQLLSNLTALENVLLPYTIQNNDVSILKYRINTLFSIFGINNVKNIKCKDLSGGEKQRVAFIRALIKDPEILLLDEPTSALDEKTTELFFSYIQQIKKEKIIIVVTHNIDLVKRCDEVIDLKESHYLPSRKMKSKKINETKIHFSKIKDLYKKVFSGKKLFNYISTSILSVGLIGICLSFILSNVIKDISSQSFSFFDTSNIVTFKVENIDEEIDFSKPISGFNTTFYQGIDGNSKTNIKSNSHILYADFNLFDIEDTNFIFDNYLSNFEDNLVVAIPEAALDYVNDSNYITIYLDKGFSLSIYINSIILSNDESFYLYCNNIDYLYSYFKHYSFSYDIESYLFCEQANKLYKHLMSDTKYQKYYFYKYENFEVIQIMRMDNSRIASNTLLNLKNSNPNAICLLSDYVHTYIDYDSGFLYLLFEDQTAIQVIIDTSIEDEFIDITSKCLSVVMNDTISSFDAVFNIRNVLDENNYAIIYMNEKTFNNLNDDMVYSGLFLTDNKESINAVESIMINKKLFEVSSFKVFDYIIDFLLFFSIIILSFSIISSLLIFNINFENKKREIGVLLTLGIYKEVVLKLLLYDPLNNILSSLFTTGFTVIITKIMIIVIYSNLNGTILDFSLSIPMTISIVILPFILIFPYIVAKIYHFFYLQTKK